MVGPDDPHNLALGRAIAKLREEAGLSEAELAAKADLPLEDLRQIEAGEVDADWGTLRVLAAGLGVPLPDLFRLTEEPERES